MKLVKTILTVVMILFFVIFNCQKISAVTNYVSLSGGHVLPFTSWADAATNIQDALDEAGYGGFVLVTNGVYVISTNIIVESEITLKSVNGPDATIVQSDGSCGCFFLSGFDCFISGFTITNGNVPGTFGKGGGVYCYENSPVVSNCVISGNYADFGGGGAYHGTLVDCTISGNSSDKSGGGTYYSDLINCTVSGNSVNYQGGGANRGVLNNCIVKDNVSGQAGGGVYYSAANNSIIVSNWAGISGGGVYNGTVSNSTISFNSIDSNSGGGAFSGVLVDCLISYNISSNYGGGMSESSANNCTIIGNRANSNGGGTHKGTVNYCKIIENISGGWGGGSFEDTVNNCEITGNTATRGAGMCFSIVSGSTIYSNSATAYGGGTYSGSAKNCIIYYNTSPSGANHSFSDTNYVYCCTTPIPLGGGDGNITSPPEFVDEDADNFHLFSSSACVNSGSNALAVGEIDLDDIPRILGGTVDMGCYELSRNPLLLAPTITVPITLLGSGAGVFTSTCSNVKISGIKSNNQLIARKKPNGMVFTNEIQQSFAGTTWEHEVFLSGVSTTIIYFATNADVSETSLNKTTLTIIMVAPQIATNALIFPSSGAELFEGDLTNIIWNVDAITDNIDGTNLTITKITVHLSETTNEVGLVTNDVSNLLGEIPWLVPEYLIGGNTNYVLRFEVVDSSSLTNSRIFWDNKFTIVPEPCLFIIYNLLFMIYYRRKFFYCHKTI